MCIGAFFDLDGTLLGPPSLERRFLRYLRWRGEFGAADGARWLARFLQRAALNWSAATVGNKAHLAGIRVATVDGFARLLARRPPALFPAPLERLAWHSAQGHKIFLVSGTLAPLARTIARQLPCSLAVGATELEVRENGAGEQPQRCWTGEIAGEAICGPGKAQAIERLAAAHGLDLSRSYAYGDAWSDRWMLERVGHPAVVNPSWRLARLARRRGWAILNWAGQNSRAAPVADELRASSG